MELLSHCSQGCTIRSQVEQRSQSALLLQKSRLLNRKMYRWLEERHSEHGALAFNSATGAMSHLVKVISPLNFSS